MTKAFEGVKFVAPEGRLVHGHPMIMHDKKNYNTRQVELDKNGQVRRQIMFKVAYPEQIFLSQVWPHLAQAAAQGFGGQQVPQTFKYKFKHHSELDKKGRPYGEREGCAGCYIVTYTTEAFAPKSFKQTAPNTFVEITNPDEIKTGYHVVVEVVARHNGNYGDTGGLYVNPNQVLLTRYDSEIFSNAADPNDAFGGMSNYVLQGNNPNGGQPPQYGNAPQAGAPMPQGQPPQYAAPPAHDLVNNAIGGQPPQYGNAPQAGAPMPQGQYNAAPVPQGQPPQYGGAPMPNGTFPAR